MMEIKLSLSLDTVNACLSGLGKLPFEFSAQHVNIIQSQAGPQVEAEQKKQQAAQQEEIPTAGLTD